MPAPMDWEEAPEEERASLQGTLRMERENIVVDYLIFSPSRETQLIVAEYPAGDSQLRLPDTEDLAEMEAYVDENTFMLEEFARSASPRSPAWTSGPWSSTAAAWPSTSPSTIPATPTRART